MFERALQARPAVDAGVHVRRQHGHRTGGKLGGEKDPVADAQFGYQLAQGLLALAVHWSRVDYRAAQLDHTPQYLAQLLALRFGEGVGTDPNDRQALPRRWNRPGDEPGWVGGQ